MTIGVDVSKWNVSTDGKTLWNPDNAKRPIDFVIQRVSYGGSSGSQVQDELLEPMYQQVIKVPIRGAYHYYSSHSNWKTQADFFLNIVSKKNYHFYAIDYETTYNTLDKRTVSEFSEFVKYVKTQTKKKTLCYFNWNVFNTYIKPYGYDAWVNSEDIWYAWYPFSTDENPPTTVPRPIGMNMWKIHQYGAGDISNTPGANAGLFYGGGTRGIDLNQFNGSVDNMIDWCNGEKPTTISDKEKLDRLWNAHKELW